MANRKLDLSTFDRTARRSAPSRRASRPATAPTARDEHPVCPVIHRALNDEGLANTLLYLAGSAGFGLIGLFLLLQSDHVESGERVLTKVGAGTFGVSAVVFYCVLLKVVLGPAAVTDLLDENKKKPLHVLAGVVVSFTAFMTVVGGGVVSALS